MAWSGVITDAGQALIDSWMSGSHTLTIDGASIGSGTVATADMHSSTALVSEKDDAAIVRTETVTGGVKIRLQFGPTELTNAYSGKEIGIWARLDGGTKTLLSLHQDDGDGVAIPKKSTFPDFAFAIACVLNTSNTANLAVTVDTTACATIGDLEDAIEEVTTETDFKTKTHVYSDLTHDGSTLASIKAAIGTCLISFRSDLQTHYGNVSDAVNETFFIKVKTSLCDSDCMVTVDTTSWFSFIAQTADFRTVSGKCYIDASTTPATYSIADADFSSFARDEDVITLEIYDQNNRVDGHDAYWSATLDVSQYIDNADNYMIIGAAQYYVKNSSSDNDPFIERWYTSFHNTHMSAQGYLTDAYVSPCDLSIYNSGSQRLLTFMLYNATSHERKVKLRVMLKRIRNIVSLV